MKLANALQLTHPNGNATYVVAVDVEAGTPVKIASGQVTPPTAATDVAIGVTLDGAATAKGDLVELAHCVAFALPAA